MVLDDTPVAVLPTQHETTDMLTHPISVAENLYPPPLKGDEKVNSSACLISKFGSYRALSISDQKQTPIELICVLGFGGPRSMGQGVMRISFMSVKRSW